MNLFDNLFGSLITCYQHFCKVSHKVIAYRKGIVLDNMDKIFIGL